MTSSILWITFISLIVCIFARVPNEIVETFEEVGDERVAVAVAPKKDMARPSKGGEYDNKRRELEEKYDSEKRALDDWFKVGNNILKRSYNVEEEKLKLAVKDVPAIELKHFDAAAIGACVADTNSYRRKEKDTPDMKWDADLARGAQEWANRLAKESLNGNKFAFYHATSAQRPGAGENLYWGVYHGSCANANKAWYGEVKDWDFAHSHAKPGKSFHNIGHFSQLVWKKTTKFGIGIAKGNFGKYWKAYKYPQYFVVGRYSPPGNYGGQFKQNIGQLV